jgi:hypothetical protein
MCPCWELNPNSPAAAGCSPNKGTVKPVLNGTWTYRNLPLAKNFYVEKKWHITNTTTTLFFNICHEMLRVSVQQNNQALQIHKFKKHTNICNDHFWISEITPVKIFIKRYCIPLMNMQCINWYN